MGGKPEEYDKGFTDASAIIGTEDVTTFSTDEQHRRNPNTNTTTTETSGLNPPKRKRGRPTGWRKDKTTTSEKASIDFQEEEQVTATTNAFTKKRKKAFMSESEANSTSEFILATIDMLGVALLKTDEAKLNPLERGLLVQSIPKYLQTLETNTIEKATNLMYPLMGILGVSMYGLRVVSIVVDKRKENQAAKQVLDEHQNIETSQPDEHTNGVNPQWTTQPNLQNDLNMQTRNRQI